MSEQMKCVFCEVELDGEQEVIFETETCYYVQKKSAQVILEGSGLIVPKAHKETVFDLSAKEWEETGQLLIKAKKLLDEQYSPDGYSVGWNTGEVGGQSIPHAHLHVIPRFDDEPYAGKGIRYWIKQEENRRPGR